MSQSADHDHPPSPPDGRQTMRAMVHRGYSGPDELRLEQLPIPTPAEDEVLVKVLAAAVNPLDWHMMTGTPYIARITKPINRQLNSPGVDFAGRVEAVGASVTSFEPGDEVFGSAPRAFADYTVAGTDRVVAKPANLSFEEAAALPVAGLTALQGLRDKGGIEDGHNVLVIGASGGVGTYAVQLAKSFGATVTGVCSGRNVELVTSIGADEVLDYTSGDFIEMAGRQSGPGESGYDVVIDNVGTRSLRDIRSVMKADGTYVCISGPKGKILGPVSRLISTLLLSPFVSQSMKGMLAVTTAEDMTILGDLAADGRIRSCIDRRFPLAEAAEALRYQSSARARSKIIIEL